MFKDKAEKYQKCLTSWFSDVYIDKNEEYFKIEERNKRSNVKNCCNLKNVGVESYLSKGAVH